ncbi:MAG: glycosyltransferase [Polyangiaceae bacterium]|nr:glycosyltransferase [Polyangiaceae bacterium]
MRIAQVLYSLDMGGQEMMALHLTRELMARGHDVTVVTMTPGGSLRADFAPAKVVDAPRKGSAGIDPKAWPTLFRTFLKIKPDVVHTHAPGPLLYAVPAARLAGVHRIVHTSHGANVTQLGPRSIALGRAVALLLTRFVPVSDETAETARSREKIPAALIQVIPNGIPLDKFGPNVEARARVREALGIDEDAFVVGTVGRVEAVKNHKLFVAAMSKIVGVGTHAVIVGGGSLLEEVRAAVPEHARSFIHLTGPRRDIPELLAAFDVFTLTSTTEGLPLSVPEAMATELPVVATSVGSLPTIVPRDTGILVASEDEAALVAAYTRLRDNPRARREMAKAARAFAQSRFSLAKMVDAYEAIYRDG